jgi:hypothetical protein
VVCGALLWVKTQFLARPDSPVSSPTQPQPNPSVKQTFLSVNNVSHPLVRSSPTSQIVMVQVPTSVLSASTELVSLLDSLANHVKVVPNVVLDLHVSWECALH